MDITFYLKEKIIDALKTINSENHFEYSDIVIENSKDPIHGDYASNVAMKYSKLFKTSPRLLAEQIINNIDKEKINKIEIAGPGFINFFMKSDSLSSILPIIIQKNEDFGRGEYKNKKINVEFVSANPTGDLHVGHARGAAIGDSVCRILSFAGYDVTREYYINDAGNQINNLALSLIERYKQICGLDYKLPEDGYHGEDILNIAKKIKEYTDFDPLALPYDQCLDFFKSQGIKLELEKIIKVLDDFGVHFDVFSSEINIRKNNAVENEIKFLKPYIYEDEGALKLKTSQFLDDKDRVIVKKDGSYTYFLPDIVYHVNKISRGYDKLIDVLGADHHGYINRMKSALMMHGFSKDCLEIELIQMVRIMKDGKEIKASKRTGNAITLQELIEEVGKDATRFFFSNRAASMHLDFDINLAKEQSSSNPVYYAQYAHARLARVLELAKTESIDLDITKQMELTSNSEINLLKIINEFPNEVNNAATERAPYKIANYIHRLAEAIHYFYTECKIIDKTNYDLTNARLILSKASKITMHNALDLLGVKALNKM